MKIVSSQSGKEKKELPSRRQLNGRRHAALFLVNRLVFFHPPPPPPIYDLEYLKFQSRQLKAILKGSMINHLGFSGGVLNINRCIRKVLPAGENSELSSKEGPDLASNVLQ